MATAVHDFDGAQTYSEKPGHNFTVNATFDEIDPRNYDALVIPGGRPGVFALNEQVLSIVRHFAASSKPIAAICHGAQLLAAAGALRTARVPLIPRCTRRFKSAGGKYVEVAINAATCRRQSGHGDGVAGTSSMASKIPGGAGHADRTLVPCLAASPASPVSGARG